MNIILRKLTTTDATPIARFLQDKEVVKYLADLPDPYTLETAETFIRLVMEWEKTGEAFHFAVSEKSKNDILGVIGVKLIDQTNKIGEIGFWLGREYWGKGVISKAIPQLISFAFNELTLHALLAEVFEWNTASMKALEKSGFTGVGLSQRKTCNSKTNEPVYLFKLENKG
jgi:RimJ/RimL family protein N-acetyltransferase